VEEAFKALLQANIEITHEAMSLARAVLEQRGMYAQTTPSAPMSFDNFVSGADQEMTNEEKLFYSEEEEDEKFNEDFGGRPTDTSFTKAILEAAGEKDLAAQLDIDA